VDLKVQSAKSFGYFCRIR